MIRIRTMTPADLELGMRLKSQAGWNQTLADWRRMLEMQPDGCFVAQWQGTPVGTAVACLFDRVAWIAMVLVDESVRGQGIGGALLKHTLAFVEEQGVPTIRLDATPLGQPLYEKLGFVPQYVLHRYAGRLRPTTKDFASSQDRITIRQAIPADYAQLLELDRRATHTDRTKFLLRLFAERPDTVFVANEGPTLRGFLATRAGQALQLGPCIADAEAGERLLKHALPHFAGESVVIDLSAEQMRATQLVRTAGLVWQRPLLRMCRGPALDDDLALLYASSGPELG